MRVTPFGMRILRRCGAGLLLLAVLSAGLAVIPNPATPAGFSSAGLGATRAAWKRSHKADPVQDFVFPFTEPFYLATDDSAGLGPVFSVSFWPEGWLAQDEARITEISTIYWSEAAAETPLSLTPKLIPGDSRLISTGASDLGLETYNSPALATHYPARLFSGDPWAGSPPGTFYVFRRQRSVQVWIPAVHKQIAVYVQSRPTPAK